jgi:thioredoxin-related protein
MNACLHFSVVVKLVSSVLLFFSAGFVKASDDNANVWVKALPGTKITDSRPEPHFPGMYELVMGNKVVYGDATGRYLIFGHIYDTHTQKDVTQARLDSLSYGKHIDWGDVPVKYAVRHNTGDASTKLAVLFSPECGYCKKFYEEYRSELSEDVVAYFLVLAVNVPRNKSADAMESFSYLLADRIVCGVEPEKNLQIVMRDERVKNGFIVNSRQTTSGDYGFLKRKLEWHSGAVDVAGMCDSEKSLGAVRDFANKYGLSATPTFISEDGRVHIGYLPKSELLAWLHSKSVVENK